MLLQIRDKDLVAIEMRYHRSCYKRYVKFLTEDKSVEAVDILYKKTFDIFCRDILEDKIIKQNSIMRLNKLVELFVKIFNENESVDITGYINCLLKRRIKKLYPQISFIKRYRSNTETEDSDTEIEQTISNPRPQASGIRDLYFSEKSLKQVLNIPSVMSCWPPK